MVPVIHDKLTLDQILEIFDRHDRCDISLLPEEIENLTLYLSQKVDACKYKVDEIRARAGLQLIYSNEHKEAADTLNREAERLEKRMVWAMQARGFEKIKGIKYSVRVNTSYETEISEKPFHATKVMFPEYVREKITYSWDKDAIKSDLEAGKCPLAAASITKNYRPVFKINKESANAEE
jgi:hypothetical protein